MGFEAEFNIAAAKTIKAAQKTMKATALTIGGQIVSRTPVDKGDLRGNWQTTINSPALGEVSRVDKSGQLAKSAMNQVLSNYDIEDAIYFTNNLPYAVHIENGTPNMRPFGMVKGTLTAVNHELAKNARKFEVK